MYTVRSLVPRTSLLHNVLTYDLWVKCGSYVNILVAWKEGGPGNEATVCPSHMCVYVHVMMPGIGRNTSCTLGDFHFYI